MDFYSGELGDHVRVPTKVVPLAVSLISLPASESHCLSFVWFSGPIISSKTSFVFDLNAFPGRIDLLF